MNIKDELNELKSNFMKFTESLKKKDLKYGSVMTADGKTVSYDGEELEIGAAVMIDGQAAEDGVYTLEGGSTITVAGGVVTEMTEVEAEPAMDMAGQFSAINEKITGFEAKFAEMEKNFSDTVQKFQTAIEQLSESMGKSLDLFEKFSAVTPEPENKPISKRQQIADKHAERAAQLAAAFKNLQKN